MKNLRIWGKPPFSAVVLHGGPGAAGAVAPVAEELSTGIGVLEPLQTRDSINGQVEELKEIVIAAAQVPAVIVGHSWGAYLGFIFASRYPEPVKKLILIASPPFEQIYAESIGPERLNRLSEEERLEALALIDEVNEPGKRNSAAPMARLAELFEHVDEYDPLPGEKTPVTFSQHIYDKIWPEASRLRKSGELLAMAKKIPCPVVGIHGDYDPHPAEGVQKPLSRVLRDFSFYLLKNCGHEPWNERQARDEFYRILKREVKI